MSHLARLSELLETVPARLAAIPDEDAARKPSQDRWSKKEVLGHLIDSAANNHQRFVRANLQPDLALPGYAQNDWVRVQAYQTQPWRDLIELWRLYNRHLAQVIAGIPEASLAHTFTIDGRPAVTLGFVVEDYVRHLEHHLGQILAA